MAHRLRLGDDACREAYPGGSLRGPSRRRTTCLKRIRAQPPSLPAFRRELSRALRTWPPATQMAVSLGFELLLCTGRATSTHLRRRTRRFGWSTGLRSSDPVRADLQEPRESAAPLSAPLSNRSNEQHLSQGTLLIDKRSSRMHQPLVKCVVASLEREVRQIVRRGADGLDPPSTEGIHQHDSHMTMRRTCRRRGKGSIYDSPRPF